MSTHKRIDQICVIVLVCTIVLTVVFMNGKKIGIVSIVDQDAESYSGSEYFTENDGNAAWDTSGATVIGLNGTQSTVSGKGAYAYDGNIYIKNGGYYVLSGTLEDGSIIVDAYKSSKVWILLDGAMIHCSDDACLRIEQADKVFVTLAEGSENTFTSGGQYQKEALDDGTGGAVFTHDDLTINGSGALTIRAEYKHGIDANDDLVIAGGTITIEAVQDGIHANDSVRIREALLTIEAQDDGICVTADEGFFYMESGRLFINDCYEGIEAVKIEVAGGEIEIYPTDDGMNANGGSSQTDFGEMTEGHMRDMSDGNSVSENGIRQRKDMSEDRLPEFMQSVSENGALAHPVDGMDAKIPADFIQNTESGTGDTSDSADAADKPESYIRITGGSVTVINANGQDADGLDSNGSICIEGGTVFVSLSGDGSNCALDYGSENGGILEINGGTVVACGGSSMVEDISETSTQCSVLYLFDGAAADTELTVTAQDGGEILSYGIPTSYTSVIVSTPEFVQDGTYTITAGESSENVTLSSVVTKAGSTSGGIGGAGMRGGFGGAFGRTAGMEQMEDMDLTAGSRYNRQQMVSTQQSTGEQNEADSPDNAAGDEPDLKVWIWLAASVFALFLGLILAKGYKKW